MLRTKVVKGALGLAALVALCATAVVHAQSGGAAGGATGTTGAPTTSNQGTSGQGAMRQSGSGQGASGQSASGQSTSQGGQAGATASGGAKSGAALSAGDRKMLMTMAMADMAEIEMARMAQSKSQNDQVKSFAQQMIDDHTKALTDVQQLAQTRGVTLPSGLDRAHRAKADKLAKLSGDAFDQAYMAQAGVSDHKKNHSHLRTTQSRARDPEVKALAARTMPIVGQHLNAAQQLHQNTARGRSGTQGTTGSSPDRQQPNQNQPGKQGGQDQGQQPTQPPPGQ